MSNEPLVPVTLRGGFSDRNRIKSEPIEMQYKDFDERTRIALVNTLSDTYDDVSDSYYGDKPLELFRDILRNVYGQLIEGTPNCQSDAYCLMKRTILKDSYDSVLTVIEFWVQHAQEMSIIYNCSEAFNEVFKREYVGYRFVNRIIVPITDEQEIQSIENAVNSPFAETNIHLDKALKHIADREHPDYENSIKESISAVEATCNKIAGKRGSLGETLKVLQDRGVSIHPSLKSGFEKIFGYASDAKGIRHAGDLGGTNSTFEEAQFMLVACSAFVNYLIGNTSK